MYMHPLLLLTGALAFYVQQSAAEGEPYVEDFYWGWANRITETFSPCQKVSISLMPVHPGDTFIGKPPYFMYAFEVGGIPTRQEIGSDPTNLTWTVMHPPGAKLMLGIVDSENNNGGIPNKFYSVVSGTNTGCLTTRPNSTSLISLSANVTDRLETCVPWGLKVSNGKGPYTVVLSFLGAGGPTTAVMEESDDVLIYPNRAAPDRQLMASVYDSTGTWGLSTSTVETFGSKDVSCNNLAITSKTQKEVDEEAEHNSAERRLTRTTFILSVVLGITLPLLAIFTAVVYWLWRRKQQSGRGTWEGQDMLVTPWQSQPPSNGTGGQTEMREASSRTFSQSPSFKGYTVPLLPSTPSTATPHELYYPSSGVAGPSTPGVRSTSSSGAVESTPAHRKGLEGGSGRLHGHSREVSSSSSSQLPPGAAPGTTPASHIAYLDNVRADIIIQHRDGGSRLVQELPPPYTDRTTDTV